MQRGALTQAGAKWAASTSKSLQLAYRYERSKDQSPRGSAVVQRHVAQTNEIDNAEGTGLLVRPSGPADIAAHVAACARLPCIEDCCRPLSKVHGDCQRLDTPLSLPGLQLLSWPNGRKSLQVAPLHLLVYGVNAEAGHGLATGSCGAGGRPWDPGADAAAIGPLPVKLLGKRARWAARDSAR